MKALEANLKSPVDSLGPALRWVSFDFLSARRRWQIALVFCLLLLGGLAELFTIGAVFPLLAALAAPPGQARFGQAGELLARFGIDPGALSVTLLAAIFCLAAVGAAGLRILLAWASQKLVFRVGFDLSVSLYERILHQPYSFHVNMNSSRLISEVNSVQRLLTNMLLPMMEAISALIIGLFIMIGLLLISPGVAVFALLGFGSIYAVVSLWSRPRLRRNAAFIKNSNKARVQAVQEGVGGIRDVLLDNSQSVHVKRFSRIETQLRDAQAANALIAVTPRFVVEAVGMVLIVGLALALSYNGSIMGSLPVLAVLALGAQRLMPLLQKIYNGWTSVQGNQAIFLSVVELLQLPLPPRFEEEAPATAMRLQRELRIHHLTMRFAPENPPVLTNINLVVPRGARVGFVGRSGSGKSTLMDLLMGLLQPTGGAISVDGVRLEEANVLAWQAQIAHVPQHIFLSDGSILENIAFGVPPRKVNLDRVREACRKAELEELVESLPEGLDTVIGERGVRLSGGQRQRIGVARALYKDASVLILDEATSALDDETEASIMASVQRLGDEYTILMIAHRLSTLRECDIIFRLEDGRIVDQGSFAEVIRHDPVRAVEPVTGG